MEKAQSDDKIKKLAGDTRAYLCIDCSKCTGSCPIGKAGSIYSPRSLVQHLMLEGRDPAQTDLWRCLTCGLCKERCPQDVRPIEIIIALKNLCVESGEAPDELDTMLRSVRKTGRAIPVSSLVERRRSEMGLEKAPDVPIEELRRLAKDRSTPETPPPAASEESGEPEEESPKGDGKGAGEDRS